MISKVKKIQKQNKGNSSVLPIKPKSQLRNQLQKRLKSPKFNNNIWLQILQMQKLNSVANSQNFKTIVKQHRQFTCCVCMSIMVFPTILSCGHTYCVPCIQQVTYQYNTCCLCRKYIHQQYFPVAQNLNTLIKTICVPSLTRKEQDQFWKRYNNYKLWDHMSMIPSKFKIGELIHFMDYEQTAWRYGVIASIKYIQYEIYFVVKPLYNREDFEEYVQFHYLSKKIARFQFFHDIEMYRHLLNTNNDDSRDSILREAMDRKIKEGKLYEAYNYYWKQPSIRLIGQTLINIYKYLPPSQRQYDYDIYTKLTFDAFNQNQKMIRYKLKNSQKIPLQDYYAGQQQWTG